MSRRCSYWRWVNDPAWSEPGSGTDVVAVDGVSPVRPVARSAAVNGSGPGASGCPTTGAATDVGGTQAACGADTGASAARRLSRWSDADLVRTRSLLFHSGAPGLSRLKASKTRCEVVLRSSTARR